MKKDVKIYKKMIDRPPLLEEPFAQTLSGKNKEHGLGSYMMHYPLTPSLALAHALWLFVILVLLVMILYDCIGF